MKISTVGKLQVPNSCETTKYLRIIFDGQQCYPRKVAIENGWKPVIVIRTRKIPMLQNVMSWLAQVLNKCADEIQHNIDKQ